MFSGESLIRPAEPHPAEPCFINSGFPDLCFVLVQRLLAFPQMYVVVEHGFRIE